MTESPKTIIHVPRRFVADEWGGTETVILEISKQQQRGGARPEIFTSLALSNTHEEELGGIPVRRFGYCYPFFGLSDADRSAMDKKGGNLLSLSLFAALMREPNVRIFHAHTLKRLGGEVLTAARLRNKPFIVTIHGGVFDVPAAEKEKMAEAATGKLEWGKPFGALFRSRCVLEDADHVLCLGEGEMDKARKQLPHNRISLLPNGVDPEKFARDDGAGFRTRHGIAPDAFVVLCLSRIDFQKNQLALLEAFEEFRTARPDARLVLIGPETQPDYAAKLRSFIQLHQLESFVTILGGLRNDDPELVNAYHACDVFVLPSIHEPFGIVVLEAWCCKKPAIVSSVGGLKSLIRDGETGLFFDPARGGAEELASKLEIIARQPQLGFRMGQEGFKEIGMKYTWNAVAQQLENIYAASEHRLREGRTTR